MRPAPHKGWAGHLWLQGLGWPLVGERLEPPELWQLRSGSCVCSSTYCQRATAARAGSFTHRICHTTSLGLTGILTAAACTNSTSPKVILTSAAGQHIFGHLGLAWATALCSCCGCPGGRCSHCLLAGAGLLQLPHSTSSPSWPGLACRPLLLLLLLPPWREVQPPPACRCSLASASLCTATRPAHPGAAIPHNASLQVQVQS